MRKNIKNLHSGFTISELLLSMLVVMIVAAAMVPIIGPKKIKVPNISKSHGIFECYYTQSGQLLQYQANNRGLKDGQLRVSPYADHCVFQVPAADKYEIFAIGAGSDGYRDPSGVGYDITEDSFTKSGYLRLSNFQEDIARAGQYAGELQGINNLPGELRKLLNEWADRRRAAGADLYTAFSGLKSPLGAGGSGLAKWKLAGGHLESGVNCQSACDNGSISCRGPWGENWREGQSTTATTEALAHDMCYFYVHAKGGKSAKGRVMNPGDVLLFPVDGDARSSFSIAFDTTRSYIQTKTRNGEAYLDIKAKQPGKDAYYNSSTMQLTDGGNPTENTPSDAVRNNTGVARILHGASNRALSLNDIPYDDNHRNAGSQYGIQQGNGLKKPGDPAKAGQANYRNAAFEWTYSALGVNYSYGSAGEPGDIHQMTYNNLHGNLYLFPGTSSGGVAVDTVVSKSDNRDDVTGHVLTAASKVDPGTSSTASLMLTRSIMPTPHGEIIDAATADNSRFAYYISKINTSGFRGGLYRCNEAGVCPGYAGSGAYPFITVANGTNILKVTDRQTLYNNGSYSKPFAIVREADEAPTCPFGEVYTKYGTKYYTDMNGVLHSYTDSYCVATNDQRRDGAVVIVW